MPEPSVVQNEQHQRLEVKLRRELGETILGLLNDNAVEDIVLNPDATLWVKQMGSGSTRAGQMSGSQAVCAMNIIASMRSMVLNYEQPVLETELPLDGSRLEGLIPPVVRHPVFTIRRRPRRIFTLDQYRPAGILTGKTDPLNRLRRRENFADQLAGLPHADVKRAHRRVNSKWHTKHGWRRIDSDFSFEGTEMSGEQIGPLKEAAMQLLDALDRLEAAERGFQDRLQIRNLPSPGVLTSGQRTQPT